MVLTAGSGQGLAVEAEEILQALEKGGFDFKKQGWTQKTQLRNLTISMSKNSSIFHRLPNGTYGLVKFYPEIEAAKKKGRAGKKEEEPRTEDDLEAAVEVEASTPNDSSENDEAGAEFQAEVIAMNNG